MVAMDHKLIQLYFVLLKCFKTYEAFIVTIAVQQKVQSTSSFYKEPIYFS